MEALIFDSHAHYDDGAFDGDRDALLERLPALGVCHVINVGASLRGCERSAALAERYPYFHAAAGIHPEELKNAPTDWLTQVEALLKRPKMVAVGEIGLDYHFAENAPREQQRQAFEEQLLLANRLKLPVIVHDRDAHGDTMELLRRHRPKGVLHCFSGSVEMMREAVSLGLCIGLGGAVTFKNARVPAEVARAVPADRLLLETDCPYMAPVPFRGKRCDSSLILHTATRISELRGEETEKLLKMTRDNAMRLFRLLPDNAC